MHPVVPYFPNPSDTHCSQACLRMGYEYFNPERQWSWDALDRLTHHVEGLTTWNMKAYVETVKLGYEVVIFDVIDFHQFVLDPKGYIAGKFSPPYAEETFRLSDMNQAVIDAKELISNDEITLHARSYTLDEYKKLLDDGYLAATWVDGAIINSNFDKCWPHFIMVFSYDDKGIIAHDPGDTTTYPSVQNRHIPWDVFEKANKINKEGERGEVLAFRKPKDEK